VALEFARKHKVICVLKDSSTVVSDGNRVYFNRTGNHGMATGGSGDVLAGLLGTLAGSQMPLFQTAYMGVYLHGSAGDMAAKRFGARGMTSVELLEGLPEVLKKLD
jgi:NAD(P)H-hydrate epimerase